MSSNIPRTSGSTTSSESVLAVVGLGYVGLPLATLAREKGWDVVGYDINQSRVSAINAQKSPVSDVLGSGQLARYPIEASIDPSIVARANVVVVAVPTPVTETKQPDLQPLISAIENILPHINENQTLIVESTVNPGVMDQVVLKIIRHREDLGKLKIAYCPERINPGDKQWTVRNIPRVLGAYTKAAEKSALLFYNSVLEAPVKLMDSVTEAEAVKIFENSFRDINIAFVNEMARSFDKLGIDVMNVIEGASTKPFAFMAHYPGNGVGGHCIGVDPYYMIERGRTVGFNHLFLKLARKINDSMPAFTLKLLRRGLRQAGLKKKATTVALLGLAYKKDTADDRESPALIIQKLLRKQGFNVVTFDPHFPAQSNVKSLAEALTAANVVMLATNHTEFIQNLTAENLKQHGIKLVVDGKNALDPKSLQKTGIVYLGVGRSSSSSPSAAAASA